MAEELSGDWSYVVDHCGMHISEYDAINSAEIICDEYEIPDSTCEHIDWRKQAASDLYNAMTS